MKKVKTILVRAAVVAFGALAMYGAFCAWREVRLSRYPIYVMQKESELYYYEYKCELVKCVKAYIDSVAPTSSLNGYAVVDVCEKYDMDIKFVLAQGQLESHFGTNGIAVKTNSVFNIGAYDGKSADEINSRYKYRHPDHSIEPYIRLLYRNYLVRGKTETDLLGRYVDKHGVRYSTNQQYERDLFNIYSRINKATKIAYLQGEMRRFKIICGK